MGNTYATWMHRWVLKTSIYSYLGSKWSSEPGSYIPWIKNSFVQNSIKLCKISFCTLMSNISANYGWLCTDTGCHFWYCFYNCPKGLYWKLCNYNMKYSDWSLDKARLISRLQMLLIMFFAWTWENLSSMVEHTVRCHYNTIFLQNSH